MVVLYSLSPNISCPVVPQSQKSVANKLKRIKKNRFLVKKMKQKVRKWIRTRTAQLKINRIISFKTIDRNLIKPV